MGAGAARVGRLPHAIHTQDADTTTSTDTLESSTGRAPGSGAVRAGAAGFKVVPATKLRTSGPQPRYATRDTTCFVDACLFTSFPAVRTSGYDLSEYVDIHM
jgi:hypothetical protein